MGQAPDCCKRSHSLPALLPAILPALASQAKPAEASLLHSPAVTVKRKHSHSSLMVASPVEPQQLLLIRADQVVRLQFGGGQGGKLGHRSQSVWDSPTIGARKGQPWLTGPDCCKA